MAAMRRRGIAAWLGLAVATAAGVGSAAVTAIVKTGDAAPGGPPGAIFQSASTNLGALTPAIDAVGGVIFVGRLAVGAGGVTSANDTVVWAPAFGGTVPVAREGDPVPGAPGWTFADFEASFGYDGHTIAAGGGAAFSARIENASLGTTGEGLFQTGLGGAVLVAKTGDEAPGTPPGVAFSTFGRPAQNAGGRITVHAGLRDEPGIVDDTNDAGIWVSDAAGALHLVIREGDIAPGLLADHVLFLGQPEINASGELLIDAILELHAGQVAPDDYRYILWKVSPGGVFQLIARTDGPAPGADPGTVFGSIENNGQINAAGEIAFSGRYRIGPGGVTADYDSGLFVTDAAGTLYVLYREGDPAPGAPPGAVFGDSPALLVRMNARGDVAFLGRLASGPGGITSARSQAVFGPGLVEPVTMLSQRGDPAPGIPGRWLGTPIFGASRSPIAARCSGSRRSRLRRPARGSDVMRCSSSATAGRRRCSRATRHRSRSHPATSAP
jgi:hypothetical protein